MIFFDPLRFVLPLKRFRKYLDPRTAARPQRPWHASRLYPIRSRRASEIWSVRHCRACPKNIRCFASRSIGSFRLPLNFEVCFVAINAGACRPGGERSNDFFDYTPTNDVLPNSREHIEDALPPETIFWSLESLLNDLDSQRRPGNPEGDGCRNDSRNHR
jgi:hypothetical protein